MKKRSKAPARVLALLALIGAAAAIVLVVQASSGDDSSSKKNVPTKQAKKGKKGKDKKGKDKKSSPKTYTVQSGDNLTSIAQETGISVAEIQQLNPSVDPLALVEGEKLKLR
jgi:LysM repeat protein